MIEKTDIFHRRVELAVCESVAEIFKRLKLENDIEDEPLFYDTIAKLEEAENLLADVIENEIRAERRHKFGV